MNVVIYPKTLSGTVKIPPSKSQSHRAIIAASLAKGKSVINQLAYSDDILATIGAMEKIGVKFIKNPGQLIVNGVGRVVVNDDNFIECNESGSTLRFVIPILSLSRQKVVFTGKKSLFQRPLGVYESLFQKMQFQFQKNEDSLIISGTLVPGEYEIPGNISSQFISGLLFALPLLKEDSLLKISEPYESKNYVNMTIDMLKLAGVEIKELDNAYLIPGNQTYKPFNLKIEGDFSQMAFFAVAGVLGDHVLCKNVPSDSLQPDRKMIDFIYQANGLYESESDGILFHKSPTTGSVFDVSQTPDIAPILAILAAASQGQSIITNASRLKYKESNRLLSTFNTLQLLGVDVSMLEDGLIIQGKSVFEGGVFDSYNDHRIVMSIAIASMRCNRPVIIKNAQAVNKSYPDFFEDLKKLGATIEFVEE